MQDVIEIAKTGRASCRTCRQTIAKGELRFGEEEFNPFSGSGATAMKWHHLMCAAKAKPTKLKPVLDAYTGDVPDRAAIEAAMGEAASKQKPPYPYGEIAPTGRSKCLQCGEAIEKGTIRIAIEREVDTGTFVTKGAGYLHPGCAMDHVDGDENFPPEVLRNSRMEPAQMDELRATLEA